MAPIEYIGRYMGGWFDFAIADELHQLGGLSAGSNNGEERFSEPVWQHSVETSCP